jgi:hypothetical protein
MVDTTNVPAPICELCSETSITRLKRWANLGGRLEVRRLQVGHGEAVWKRAFKDQRRAA